MFDASRTPVRKALEALEVSGLIYRAQGRGSYVRKNVVNGALREMATFGQILRDAGYRLTAKTLEVGMIPCDAELANKMKMQVEDLVIYLNRLLIADDEPIILFSHYLRPVIPVMTLLEKGEFPSLYELLKEEGYEPWESEQLISATLLTEKEASLLNVLLPAAALVIKQTNFSIGKEVLWYSNFLIHPDRYEYPVTLQKR